MRISFFGNKDTILAKLPLTVEYNALELQLPCEQSASEIRRNVDFLATTMHDVDDRHRSMRAVFDTSWQLLEPHRGQMKQYPPCFPRLAVLALATRRSRFRV